MSVVAGEVLHNKIVLAADRQVTSSWHNKDDASKAWKIGNLAIGTVGRMNEGQLMRLFLDSHFPKSSEEHDVIEFFVEFHDYCKKHIKDFVPSNRFLLAFDDSLIHVTSDLCVFDREYDAIGSGGDYAKAALHLGHTPQQAVQVACDLTIYCDEPIDVFSVKRSK